MVLAPLTQSSHILQEMTVSSYVPNDTLLMGGVEQLESDSQISSSAQYPSMLLLTGPNYSGKSVYMKQVSIVVERHHQQALKPLGCSHRVSRADWKV